MSYTKNKRRGGGRKRRTVIEPLCNFDLIDIAAELNIPHFTGVFMRDTLSKKSKP